MLETAGKKGTDGFLTAAAAGDVELKAVGHHHVDPIGSSPDAVGRPSVTAAAVGRVVVPVEITVNHLSVTATTRSSSSLLSGKISTSIPLVQDVTMHVPSGHLMAIM
ncbi:hypothetical protein HDU67_002913, partial [Dinochytrium kinnereticum]